MISMMSKNHFYTTCHVPLNNVHIEVDDRMLMIGVVNISIRINTLFHAGTKLKCFGKESEICIKGMELIIE